MSGGRKGKSRKAGKKVRVAFRRNRHKPARDKDWTRQLELNAEQADDAPHTESVVAKGELSRKRTIIEGDTDEGDDLATGVVIAMRGLIAEVDDGQRVWPCTLRRVMRTRRIADRNPVTVGDRVRFSIEADSAGVLNEGVIEAVEPRRGTLTRMVRRRQHTIAANVDQALIVASAGAPAFKPHLVDRYIVAAHAGGIEPVICLNKIDQDEDRSARTALAEYRKLGYRTLETSALNREGLAVLKETLTGKCTAVAGQSGVGKSSLLNAIEPRLHLRVGEVNEDIAKGRHITTTAIMIKLRFGGYVVDTPGVKSFDLSAVPLNEIEVHFIDFAEYIPHCKFPDCTHIHETDCAVKQAVREQRITTRRYESYCRMFAERLRG